MLDALQHVETAGEVCPAGWNKGKAAMKANAGGIAGYLKEHSKEL
jgi:peroxiredoxin (alkyl hydroperoxide reductase subunit C)